MPVNNPQTLKELFGTTTPGPRDKSFLDACLPHAFHLSRPTEQTRRWILINQKVLLHSERGNMMGAAQTEQLEYLAYRFAAEIIRKHLDTTSAA